MSDLLNQDQLLMLIKKRVTELSNVAEPTYPQLAASIFTTTRCTVSRYTLEHMKNSADGVSQQTAKILSVFLQIPLHTINIVVQVSSKKTKSTRLYVLQRISNPVYN